MLDNCIQSLNDFVKDSIESIHIVSNRHIDVGNHKLILDHDFWAKFDPNFDYKNLYKINWIKQQLFKLAVDYIVTGKVLVLDVEVLFIRPMTWISQSQEKLHTSYVPQLQAHFDFMNDLASINHKHQHSFITDAMIFDTNVLKSLRGDIETQHNKNWISAINMMIEKHGPVLSEYETYGTYVLTQFPDQINLCPPFKHKISIPNTTNYQDLVDKARQLSNSNYITVFDVVGNDETHWLTFYQLIKDPSWPDCDDENNFASLPDIVKQECINIFNYVPKRN